MMTKSGSGNHGQPTLPRFWLASLLVFAAAAISGAALVAFLAAGDIVDAVRRRFV